MCFLHTSVIRFRICVSRWWISDSNVSLWTRGDTLIILGLIPISDTCISPLWAHLKLKGINCPTLRWVLLGLWELLSLVVRVVYKQTSCVFILVVVNLSGGGNSHFVRFYSFTRNFLQLVDSALYLVSQVRNDELDLKVPVWVTDMAFLPSSNTQPQVVVGTGHHQLRLYDTKAQRRPVQSIEFEETPITAMTVTRDDR